jgi:hypothetical protein
MVPAIPPNLQVDKQTPWLQGRTSKLNHTRCTEKRQWRAVTAALDGAERTRLKRTGGSRMRRFSLLRTRTTCLCTAHDTQ